MDNLNVGDCIRRKDSPIMQYVITAVKDKVLQVRPIMNYQKKGIYQIDESRQHAVIVLDDNYPLEKLGRQIKRVLPNNNGWELMV